jgi:hypothetical protein
MRDLTWLSKVQGSSRAAAHARFVMAHQAGRDRGEDVYLARMLAGAQLDDVDRQTLALLFPQQFPGTTAR